MHLSKAKLTIAYLFVLLCMNLISYAWAANPLHPHVRTIEVYPKNWTHL